MGVAGAAGPGRGGARGPTLGDKLERTRRLGTVLLGLMGFGICGAAASRFSPEPWADVLLGSSLLALCGCFVALLLLRLRLARMLDPERAEELQELTGRSLRLLPVLWDGLAPVLEAIDRILDAAAALGGSFPWLGSKLQGLRAGEAKTVVDSLLVFGPEAREAFAELAAAVEEADLERVTEGLRRLDGAAGRLRRPVEAFSAGGRS